LNLEKELKANESASVDIEEVEPEEPEQSEVQDVETQEIPAITITLNPRQFESVRKALCDRSTKVYNFARDKENHGWTMEDYEHVRKIIDLLDEANTKQYNGDFWNMNHDKYGNRRNFE
jgi:transcriptional/translational regulatory protein YebC/TACO1